VLYLEIRLPYDIDTFVLLEETYDKSLLPAQSPSLIATQLLAISGPCTPHSPSEWLLLHKMPHKELIPQNTIIVPIACSSATNLELFNGLILVELQQH
jgi:hypothetical protein